MTNRAVEFLLSAKDQTASAFASAQKRLQGLGTTAKNTSDSVKNSFAGLQAALAGGLFTAAIKSSIDFASGIVDAAAQTNTSVDAFQRLRFAAEQTGVSAESLQGGLQKVSRELAKARTGGSDFFKNLGIDVTKIKDGEDAMYNLADAFKAAGDSPAEYEKKLAILRELRLDPDLIPLLNQGSDGLRQLGDEAQRAGAILDTETANALEALGDKLALAGTQAKVLGSVFTAGLEPALSSILSGFTTTTGGMDSMKAAGEALGGTLRTLVSLGSRIADVFRNAGDTLGAAAAIVVQRLSGNAAGAEAIGAAAVENRNARRQAGADFRGTINGDKPANTPQAAPATKSPAPKPLRLTPKGGDGGAAAAKSASDQVAAARRALLEAQADSELTLRVDAEKRIQAALKIQFDDGLLTAQDYFTRLTASQTTTSDLRIAEVKREIAEQQKLNIGGGADALRAQAQIAKKTSELILLERERGEIAGEAARDQADAEEQLAEKLKKVRTEAFKKTEDAAGRVDKDLSRKTGRLDADLASGTISRSEYRAKMSQANKDAAESLAVLLPTLQAQADLLGGEYVDKVEEAKDRLLELQGATDYVAQSINSDLQSGISDAIGSVADGSKNPADALKSLFDGVGQSISRQVADDLASGLMKNLKSGGFDFGSIMSSLFSTGSASAGGGASSGGGFGSLISGAMSLFGFESGGYTGSAGTRNIAGVVHGQEFVMSAPAVKNLGLGFLSNLHTMGRKGAPKTGLAGFADGGYTGSGGRGSGMGGVTVNQTIISKDAESFRRSQGQIEAQAGSALSRASKRYA